MRAREGGREGATTQKLVEEDKGGLGRQAAADASRGRWVRAQESNNRGLSRKMGFAQGREGRRERRRAGRRQPTAEASPGRSIRAWESSNSGLSRRNAFRTRMIASCTIEMEGGKAGGRNGDPSHLACGLMVRLMDTIHYCD